MDDYREAQRQKWLQRQAFSAGSSSSASVPDVAPVSGSAGGSAAEGAASGSSEAPLGDAGSSEPRLIRRLHILPIAPGYTESEGHRRLETLSPELRRLRDAKELIRTGAFIRSGGKEFIVVKADPDEGLLGTETDYFVDGDPIVRYEKVQFICLWDFESRDAQEDTSVLFNEYISPHFRKITESGQDRGSIVTAGEKITIKDMEFQVMDARPCPPDLGIIDRSTMVYVDWDATPKFERIHIVPFQDTLPNAYEFDVFNDYLKPYLTRHKHSRFGVNDQFTYQGVQFKVVCCEPSGPARIGRNTTIYCEGVLHPSLRNLLPPELLEQLSHLPPGLQMLLMNTEALAGGYEERLMEVQEMLSRRRGLSNDAINHIEQFRWGESGRDEAQSQCMVCLCDFTTSEEARRLPCGHVFHAPCIDEWLRRCMDCPICKANVDRGIRGQ